MTSNWTASQWILSHARATPCYPEQKFAQYVITGRRGWRLTLNRSSSLRLNHNLIIILRHSPFFVGTVRRMDGMHAARHKNLPRMRNIRVHITLHDSSHERSLNNNWVRDPVNNFSRIARKSVIKSLGNSLGKMKRRAIGRRWINILFNANAKAAKQEGREINSRINRNNICIDLLRNGSYISYRDRYCFCYPPYCVLCTRITSH